MLFLSYEYASLYDNPATLLCHAHHAGTTRESVTRKPLRPNLRIRILRRCTDKKYLRPSEMGLVREKAECPCIFHEAVMFKAP